MSKEFTTREKGMIKNTAKTVYPMYAKLYKLKDQIEKLTDEYNQQEALIETWESGVKILTGGFTSMELCKRELIQIGVDEKTGKPINKANFKLRYEENVVPDISNTPKYEYTSSNEKIDTSYDGTTDESINC